MKELMRLGKAELSAIMWDSGEGICSILRKSPSLHDARDNLFDYLNSLERHYFNIYSDSHFKKLHILERGNAKECIRVMKNILRTENEKITGFSALKLLYEISKNRKNAIDSAGKGFFAEFIFLFKGIHGKSGIFGGGHMRHAENREGAIMRSDKLDEYSLKMEKYYGKYSNGLEKSLIKHRKRNVKNIIRHLGGKESDWRNFSWQLNHIIKDYSTLASLVRLSKSEAEGIKLAERNEIAFQITPYYLSLFNSAGRSENDRAIRAQVLPSSTYVKNVISSREKKLDMDFMGEKSTSPVEKITRRYPQILIIKPYDSCPQICVYCQRNWEIKKMCEAGYDKKKTMEAIEWIRKRKSIKEVLVTGGDPLTLGNSVFESIIRKISSIEHVERIRIGTRVLATVPFRIDNGLIAILKKYHMPGKREICIVTHFEHPSEITPDCLDAIKKIRKLGISVYNQQVFTYYNSRKYETCLLRRVLKLCGVDPYYLFNTKGKEETSDYRVPIPRIEQERKEEARLLPGLVRADEPVFNVPKLGKSHLRAWQDHEPIMIKQDGSRVYRFYPWESKLEMVDDYIYTDVPIWEYIEKLNADNEDVDEYKSIWFYF